MDRAPAPNKEDIAHHIHKCQQQQQINASTMASENNQATAAIPDEVASMWRSLDPAVRAALIASESKQVDTNGGDNTNNTSSCNVVIVPSDDDPPVKDDEKMIKSEDEIKSKQHHGGKSSSPIEIVSLTEAERLITFSDAVVAIAMTLLILPLMEASAEFDFESTENFWHEHWMNFLTLFVSFYAIWKLWLTHEYLYMRVSYLNEWLHRLNFLWLLGIVLLPVFTNFLVGSEDGIPVYIGTCLYIRIVTLFMGTIIWSDNRIWKEDDATTTSSTSNLVDSGRKNHPSGLELAFFVGVIVDIALLFVGLLLTIYASPHGWIVVILGHPITVLCELKWPQIGVNKARKQTLSFQIWDLLLEILKIPLWVFGCIKARV